MSCTYYEFKSGLFSGDYWCRKKDCRVDDDTYRKYCRDYNYSSCPIYKHTESSSPCFITTVCCQILGKDDQDPIMNNLRNFRKNILREDKKYYFILKEYDVIGPMIADALINDKDKEELAFCFYQSTILPVNDLIEKKNYDSAVSLYLLMTKALIEYYGLSDEYKKLKEKDYGYEGFDPSLAGHGIKRVRTKKV